MIFSHVLRSLESKAASPAFSTRSAAPSPWNTTLSFAQSLILRTCASAHSVDQAKQAHALGTLHGLIHDDLKTCAALILTYASFRHTSTSRLLFENSSLKRQNAFLWNTLIRAYTNVGAYDQSFSIYNRMIGEGVRPDDHTFPFVLKACTDVSAVQKGKEIHGFVVKLGFNYDVFVGNTLLSFYGDGSLILFDALQMFDEMPIRDIVTWNSIIAVSSLNGCLAEALDYFSELKLRSGLKPNSVSVVSVLPVCAALKDEITAEWIHGYVVKVGLDSQVTVCNAFVDMYGKCGNIGASKQVFDGMSEKNVVSWNAIVASFGNVGCFRDALDMFRMMLAAEMKPNSITISSLLPALVELEFFSMGKEIHAYSIRTNLESDVFVTNSLIDMYAKSGCSKEASSMFYQMEIRNVVSWNAMIANFGQNGLELEAVRLVSEMQVHGECPNSVTFTNVLPACARIASLRQGKEIHARSMRVGSFFDLFVANALTDMYAKCGYLNLARNVFDISVRDEVSYNILIVGYSQSHHCSESLQLFLKMRLAGLKYDTVSFMGVLSACANLTAIKQGKEIHGLLVRKLFHSHLFVANSLLDLYTKCGQMDLGRRIFDKISDKDVASWNTMILGYAMQGELDVAVDLFDVMKDEGVECDSVSYIAVLSACSHGGLIERGKRYFDQMCSENMWPTQMHYACMVDLLGRAGLMKEAAEFIRDMPFEPDANVWGALLGACRVYGNIELGRWAAEHLFELKPEHCGYYILLSNMYADAGRWDDANRIRMLMKSKGVKKDPGRSWVEVNSRMSVFIVPDKFEGPEAWLCNL